MTRNAGSSLTCVLCVTLALSISQEVIWATGQSGQPAVTASADRFLLRTREGREGEIKTEDQRGIRGRNFYLGPERERLLPRTREGEIRTEDREG